MRRIIFICFTLLATARMLLAADDVKLERRRFHVGHQFVAEITDRYDNNAKALLDQPGVPWPAGSSVVFVPSLYQLAVTNTRANILLLEEVLNSGPATPRMVDIRVSNSNYGGAIGIQIGIGIKID